MADNSSPVVQSPCRSLCKLNARNICVGCYRKSSEINFWTTYTNEEKLEVVAKAEQRRAEAEIDSGKDGGG